MPRSLFVRAAATLAALAITAASLEARAGEIQLATEAGGVASSWRGDGAAFGSLKLGYRFRDLVAPYFMLRVGYGAVDDRMLTMVSLGAQLWGRLGMARPYLRVGFAHQHEESMSAVRKDAFGALFGVGDGIRHRMGVDGALGVELPFYRNKKWQVFASIEGIVTGYPDPRGPGVYGGGSAGIGFNYGL